MKKVFRISWFWVFAAVLIIGLSSCENDLAEVDALQDKLDVEVETMRGVEILYSDSAEVKVRITGPVMLNHLDRSDPQQEFMEGVFVEFFGPAREVASTLSAQYAIRYEREGKIICRDSVVWASTDGQMLETEELIWDEQVRQVYTQKFARITTPGRMIYGHGFRANQDFSNARILEVDGIVPVEQ
jgi:LPS export ABC transporter protein LptC